MELLKNFNLLHSNIVIGMHANVNPSLTFTDAFKNWLEHKDADFGMEHFQARNTLYVGFLHTIDLSVLKQIFNDLANIYKKHFRYAEKNDFIEDTFGSTLYNLEKFVSHDLRFLGSPTNDSPFEYYYYEIGSREIIDFAIPTDSSIVHYKQYYKQVINLIRDIPFNSALSVPSSNEISKDFILTDKSEIHEIRTSKTDKNQFSVLQWATIFYYVESLGYLPEGNTKITKKKQFLKEQKIDTTLNHFKAKYYEAKRRIYTTKDYPTAKLELLIPFLEDHYPKAVRRIEDDLEFLNTEKEEIDY